MENGKIEELQKENQFLKKELENIPIKICEKEKEISIIEKQKDANTEKEPIELRTWDYGGFLGGIRQECAMCKNYIYYDNEKLENGCICLYCGQRYLGDKDLRAEESE